MKLGLISDTHGLLRERAVEVLSGSDHIIHAGDIGKAGILTALNELAPVVAVRGNVDKGAWADGLPATAATEAGPARIYVIHDLHGLDLDPAAAGFRIVVSGHSHKPGSWEKSGVLYVNPGAAGPRRFRLPVTVAMVDLAVLPWQVIFIDVEEPLDETDAVLRLAK